MIFHKAKIRNEKQAYKPDSVESCHLSGVPVTRSPLAAYPPASAGPASSAGLFGIAPPGVWPFHYSRTVPGFCATSPTAFDMRRRVLPAGLPCGVRTFLSAYGRATRQPAFHSALIYKNRTF